MKRLFICLFLFCSLLLLPACSTVPFTGRTRVLMTSEAEESSLGEQAWSEVLRKERPSKNRAYCSAVDRVGKNIAAIAERPDFQWEFKTFDSPQANAFCLPGGKVAVYSGLFKYVDNDAELATVMGHEIGHAIARHGGERMSQGVLQQIGATALSALTKEKYRDAAMMAYGIGTNVALILPYSRTHEYEADHIGILLMAKAGYDPRYAVSFWKKFSKSSDTNSFTEYISTHPMGEHRIEELKKYLPDAMRLYEKSKIRHGTGKRY